VKTKTDLNIQIARGLVVCLLAGLLLTAWSCSSKKSDLTVQQAYDLRMAGNADSAQVILETILAADSTNAAAWYELARTKHHIGLGNPRMLIGQLPELEYDIDKAVENDPENVIYAFYKGYTRYFTAYALIMMGQPSAVDYIGETVAAYDKVLELKPDYPEAMLYLVEMLSIPNEMGGDSARAETLAAKLAEMDPVKGAKAHEMLLAEDANRVEFWQKVVDENPGNAEAMEQLGKANIYMDEVDVGTEQLESAMKESPEMGYLLLDLTRFHLMTGMQDSTKKEDSFPKAEGYIDRYLATSPNNPMKAYTLELQAKLKSGIGDEETATKLREDAALADANYSKAFGLPPALLYTAPDEVSHYHGYFFRPF